MVKDKNKNNNNSSNSLAFGRWPQTKMWLNKRTEVNYLHIKWIGEGIMK